MKYELIIANVKTYEKTNEKGDKWRASIIDGMILGLGVIEGVFVSEKNIHADLEIGSQYTIQTKEIAKKGKLFLEIASIDALEKSVDPEYF